MTHRSRRRPRVPRLKAEHMAALTKAANVKKALANSEPSTHGTKRTFYEGYFLILPLASNCLT